MSFSMPMFPGHHFPAANACCCFFQPEGFSAALLLLGQLHGQACFMSQSCQAHEGMSCCHVPPAATKLMCFKMCSVTQSTGQVFSTSQQCQSQPASQHHVPSSTTRPSSSSPTHTHHHYHSHTCLHHLPTLPPASPCKNAQREREGVQWGSSLTHTITTIEMCVASLAAQESVGRQACSAAGSRQQLLSAGSAVGLRWQCSSRVVWEKVRQQAGSVAQHGAAVQVQWQAGIWQVSGRVCDGGRDEEAGCVCVCGVAAASAACWEVSLPITTFFPEYRRSGKVKCQQCFPSPSPASHCHCHLPTACHLPAYACMSSPKSQRGRGEGEGEEGNAQPNVRLSSEREKEKEEEKEGERRGEQMCKMGNVSQSAHVCLPMIHSSPSVHVMFTHNPRGPKRSKKQQKRG